MDFGILKRNNPKTGRRARQNAENTPKPDLVDSTPSKTSIEESSNPIQSRENPQAPPRPSRRTTALSGWGEDASTKKNVLEDSRLMMNEDDDLDLNEDIQIIPDIDDVNEDDLMQQMAAPPSVAMNQVATYRELDSDLLKKSTFQLLDNEIDLKLLTKHLLPESEVKEPNEIWEWDRLFTDVTSKMDQEVKQKS